MSPSPPRRRSRRCTALLALAGLGALAACGDAGGPDPGAAGGVEVITSIYPLTYVVERVGGEAGPEVTSLTAPGADPHDLELTPRQIGSLSGADLVVHAGGMLAPVDDAIAQQAGDSALDVAPVADLLDGEGHDEEHGDDEGHEGHDHGALDPHFWLDPLRMADVGDAVAERLAQTDPDGAEDYRANAADLRADLEELDADFASGLADCTSRDIVVSHTAFGYLAERYDLHQIGITGLTAEAEASPARLAQITRQVQDSGVDTVYAEVILGSDLAEAIARETGAEVAVLDPVEGITEESAGADYLEVMRANLQTLRTGQGCS